MAEQDSTVEDRVVAFAEQLGRIIGTVQGKADGWLGKDTRKQLTAIRDGAASLLNQLGGDAEGGSDDGEGEDGAARQGGTRKRSARKSSSSGGSKKAAGRNAGAAPVRGKSAGAGAAGRSGGAVDAPGKTHRKAAKSARGAKHSDTRISKIKAAETMRRGAARRR